MQPPPPAHAVSKVLDDDDILIEILVRIGFPTTLVRAALVCKRWLGLVSNHAFLRRFRALHPPRLLGVYVEEMGFHCRAPPFVPLFPEDPELADVIGRADFSVDDYDDLSPWVRCRDCRNGSVFITSQHYSACGVHSPLWPGRGLAVLPPLPEQNLNCFYLLNQVLSKEEEGDDVSYFYLHADCTDDELEFTVHLYALQDGSWIPHHPLAIDQLPLPQFEPMSVLVGNKIYIPARPSDIIVLDLTASILFTIQLPQGLEHGESGATTMLARAADASGVYLLHLEDFELRAWLHKGDNWLLVDTICLREMCVNLRLSDEHTLFFINQVVDYGNFLFLEMGECLLHLDIKCRTLRKVYQTTENHLLGVIPFMMIWPPTFPALNYD